MSAFASRVLSSFLLSSPSPLLIKQFFFLHFDPQISLLLFIPSSFSIPLRGEVSEQLCSALLPTAVNPGSSMAYRYLLPTAQRESGCDHSCLPVT